MQQQHNNTTTTIPMMRGVLFLVCFSGSGMTGGVSDCMGSSR